MAQHIHGGHDAHGVLTLNADFLIRVCADAEIQGVVLMAEILQRDICTDIHAGMDFNTEGEDGCDLAVQLFPWETVAGNTVPHHAPQLLALFVDGDLVSHEGQVIGGGQTAGAAADNGYVLAGRLCRLRLGNLTGPIHGGPLQAADIDGVIHHVPAAAGLAGMLADIGAGSGKGVVLPHQAHGVGIAACIYQRDVAGNVHACGTHGHTGNRVVQGTQAAMVENMLLKILPEAPDTGEDQVGGVDADGTVCRIHNDLSRLFQMPQHPHICLAVQNFGQHIRQLR